MRFTGYSFGSIRVDGVTYDHDLIIDRGKISKRKKAASRWHPRRLERRGVVRDESAPSTQCQGDEWFRPLSGAARRRSR